MTRDEKQEEVKREPGVCVAFAEKKRELPEMVGDEALVKKVWEEVDGLGYTFIWQMLVSF